MQILTIYFNNTFDNSVEDPMKNGLLQIMFFFVQLLFVVNYVCWMKWWGEMNKVQSAL